MVPPASTVAELRRTISTEILVAAGVPRTGLLQAVLRPLVWLPAQRFSHLMAELDHRVASDGLTEAVRWLLPHLVDGVRCFGVQHVPASGPLVVASNHPGSYDVLSIISALSRDDLKIYVSDVPFLRSLRACQRHLIHTPPAAHERMAAVRQGIEHLRAGGSLLVLATGLVEPDPAVMPGAEDALVNWSRSLPLLVRRVPGSRLLVAIVSGVLAPPVLRHPVTMLRRDPRLKQMLAEFIQVGQQMLFGRRFGLVPEVRFAPPLEATDLGGGRDAGMALAAITSHARELLASVPSPKR